MFAPNKFSYKVRRRNQLEYYNSLILAFQLIRKRGNVVMFDGGTLGTDAQAISSELDQIATDTQRSLATATTDQDKAIALTPTPAGSG